MRSAVRSLSIAGLMGLCGASADAAEADTFFGIMGGQMRYEEEGLDDTLEPPAITGRVGYDFSRSVGVEGRLGTTFEDETEVSGVATDFSVPNFVSAPARAGWRSADSGFGVYGIAGYSQAKLEAEASGFGTSVTVDETEEDFSYGGGLEFFFNEYNGFNVEYARYSDTDSFELDHIGVGYIRRF